MTAALRSIRSCLRSVALPAASLQVSQAAPRHLLLATAQMPTSESRHAARPLRPGQAFAATAEVAQGSSDSKPRDAHDVVSQFYANYNSNNIDGILGLMAEDCSYHDTVYLEPFVGKEAIRGYFEKVSSIVPSELRFHIENMTTGDPHNVGVRWHVDCNDFEFPFSRGCSFYEVNSQGLITSARDCVEPALKPGSTALYALKGLTPLVRKLGPKANPGNLKYISKIALGIGAFYAVYLYIIMIAQWPPGPPGISTPFRVFEELFNESINFFYINIFFHWAGLPGLTSHAEHPVSEALFNFVNAWSLMLWPAMAADAASARVPQRFRWWVGTMFLTNVFFLPFMGLRYQEQHTLEQRPKEAKPKLDKDVLANARAYGAVAAVVGAISLYWVLGGRPEAGDFAARWGWATNEFWHSRVFSFFVLDMAFYYTWQAVLLKGTGAGYRFVPFAGMAAWLIAGAPRTKQGRRGR